MSIKDNKYGIGELQAKMLEILKYFISVCEQNNLRYWLAYGTCLGAVRHNGFIPWDDDLDVQMPRSDYERLWNLFKDDKSNSRFKLCRTSKEKNYHHRVMQIVDVTTTFINCRSVNEDIEHGVYIDIIPMDGMPANRIARFFQVVHAVVYSVFNIQNKPEFNGGKYINLISAGTTLMLSLVKNKDKRYKIWKNAEHRMIKCEFDHSEYAISLTCLFKELFHPYKTEWFELRKVLFEDVEVYIPQHAEKYLAQIYGNFMKLPPENERKVKHNTVFIDLNNSYMQYKGIYYLDN